MKSGFVPFWLSLLIVLLTQCAKQSQPTGGPKDETPPKLMQSNPPDRKTLFSENEIELVFDEQIQVNNPREQIVITPSVGKKFEAAARKNKVTLKLNAELSENTTYTISFRESIQDLSESNPATNLKLAFSTGSYIDSLSIAGTVTSLAEGKPVKNFTIAAVPYSDTVNIFKHEAQWITLTNDKGEYTLENLKAGQYVVYAFDDKNKNLMVDSKTEFYGFIANPVTLLTNVSKLELPVIKLDVSPLKLISAKPLATYFNIRLSKGISGYALNSDNSDEEIFSMPEDVSTIKVYNTLKGQDSLLIHLQAEDSIENKIDTLLYLKFDMRSTNKDKFTAKAGQINFLTTNSTLKGTIIFSKPVYLFSPDSISIQLDSVNSIRFKPEDFKWEKRNTTLKVEKKLSKEIDFSKQPVTKPIPGQRKGIAASDVKIEDKPKAAETVLNRLNIPKGTFISVENDTASAILSDITTIKPETSGTILIDVKTSEQVVIELLDKKYTVMEQSIKHQSRFDNLPPGDYQIRTIIDKNANGKWDPGNYFNKVEPEPILYYRNEKGDPVVNIKANWELGPLLITPVKDVDNLPPKQ